MNKIKILMTLGNSGRGGAQTFAMNVLRTIDRERFQIDFVVEKNPPGGYYEEMKLLGSTVFLAPRFEIWNYASYRKRYNDIIRFGNYDIIHGNVSSTAVIYLKEAKKMGVATILHSHSSGYRGNWIERILKKLFSINAKKYADYWFACSDSAARRLFGKEYDKNTRYYKINNGIVIDTYKFDENTRNLVRRQLGISDKFVVGMVGSFSEAKNHEFIIDVFRRAIEKRNDCTLILVGNGPLENTVRKKVDSFHMGNNVIFTGSVSNVPEYLMAMDLLVFPSVFEGLGIVAIEAQATGLKCLCSTGVPKEASVSERCEFLPLNEDVWVEHILNSKDCNNNRDYFNELVRKSGYDIVDTVKLLSSLYTEMNTWRKNSDDKISAETR